MAFKEAPRFPDSIAFGAVGGPQWSTQVVTTRGEDEHRNQAWQMPLYAYEVDLQHKTPAEALVFVEFFATIAQGESHGFRYHDINPGEDAGTDELIGTGDGVTVAYQLLKYYTYGSATGVRVISKPVAGTVTVALNGTPTLAFTVDTATGFVTMTSPPGIGVAVRASYLFDVPVEMRVPNMALQPVDAGIWTWPSIRLQETRKIS